MRAGAHTPGNWTIDHERIGPPGEPVALLCDMTAPHGATVVDWPRGDGEAAVDDAENEANARLLAAAPDLVAIVEFLHEWVAAGADVVSLSALFGDSNDVTLGQAIRDAIAATR